MGSFYLVSFISDADVYNLNNKKLQGNDYPAYLKCLNTICNSDEIIEKMDIYFVYNNKTVSFLNIEWSEKNLIENIDESLECLKYKYNNIRKICKHYINVDNTFPYKTFFSSNTDLPLINEWANVIRTLIIDEIKLQSKDHLYFNHISGTNQQKTAMSGISVLENNISLIENQIFKQLSPNIQSISKTFEKDDSYDSSDRTYKETFEFFDYDVVIRVLKEAIKKCNYAQAKYIYQNYNYYFENNNNEEILNKILASIYVSKCELKKEEIYKFIIAADYFFTIGKFDYCVKILFSICEFNDCYNSKEENILKKLRNIFSHYNKGLDFTNEGILNNIKANNYFTKKDNVQIQNYFDECLPKEDKYSGIRTLCNNLINKYRQCHKQLIIENFGNSGRITNINDYMTKAINSSSKLTGYEYKLEKKDNTLFFVCGSADPFNSSGDGPSLNLLRHLRLIGINVNKIYAIFTNSLYNSVELENGYSNLDKISDKDQFIRHKLEQAFKIDNNKCELIIEKYDYNPDESQIFNYFSEKIINISSTSNVHIAASSSLPQIKNILYLMPIFFKNVISYTTKKPNVNKGNKIYKEKIILNNEMTDEQKTAIKEELYDSNEVEFAKNIDSYTIPSHLYSIKKECISYLQSLRNELNTTTIKKYNESYMKVIEKRIIKECIENKNLYTLYIYKMINPKFNNANTLFSIYKYLNNKLNIDSYDRFMTEFKIVLLRLKKSNINYYDIKPLIMQFSFFFEKFATDELNYMKNDQSADETIKKLLKKFDLNDYQKRVNKNDYLDFNKRFTNSYNIICDNKEKYQFNLCVDGKIILIQSITFMTIYNYYLEKSKPLYNYNYAKNMYNAWNLKNKEEHEKASINAYLGQDYKIRYRNKIIDLEMLYNFLYEILKLRNIDLHYSDIVEEEFEKLEEWNEYTYEN